MTEECVGCSALCDTSRPDEDGDGYLCPGCAKLPGPSVSYRGIGSLEALDTKDVLETVERHGWSLRTASAELNVRHTALTRYLERHAPEAIANARAERLVRPGGTRWPQTRTRERLVALLSRHDWNFSKAAASLDPPTKASTVLQALQRLAPEEYEAARRDGRIKLGRPEAA